mmetsp:Transcript_122690/g.392853  ORF Transcript_122690/g.392853 Transcript_122690/m.392853 type:complete len:204 (+) Transcript_122690:458-1069(+)
MALREHLIGGYRRGGGLGTRRPRRPRLGGTGEAQGGELGAGARGRVAVGCRPTWPLRCRRLCGSPLRRLRATFVDGGLDGAPAAPAQASFDRSVCGPFGPICGCRGREGRCVGLVGHPGGQQRHRRQTPGEVALACQSCAGPCALRAAPPVRGRRGRALHPEHRRRHRAVRAPLSLASEALGLGSGWEECLREPGGELPRLDQ